MGTAHVHRETAAEYFRSLVESALDHQKVKAADLTSYYLVNLLCQFVRPDARGPYAEAAIGYHVLTGSRIPDLNSGLRARNRREDEGRHPARGGRLLRHQAPRPQGPEAGQPHFYTDVAD